MLGERTEGVGIDDVHRRDLDPSAPTDSHGRSPGRRQSLGVTAHEQQMGTGTGQGNGGGPPDARGRSGDHDDLAVEARWVVPSLRSTPHSGADP